MFIRLAVALLASTLMTQVAAAQDNSPPARIGNTYDGTHHEPNPGAVHSNEAAAGVALPPAVAQSRNNQVQKLDQKVQDNETKSLARDKSLACSTVPATCK